MKPEIRSEFHPIFLYADSEFVRNRCPRINAEGLQNPVKSNIVFIFIIKDGPVKIKNNAR